MQPFPQIERKLFRTNPGWADGWPRHRGLPFGRFFHLEKRGWNRCDFFDSMFAGMEKELPGETVVILYFEPGIRLSHPRDSEPQRVIGLSDLNGQDRTQQLELPSLHPILFSEIFYDLEQLLSV